MCHLMEKDFLGKEGRTKCKSRWRHKCEKGGMYKEAEIVDQERGGRIN